MRGPRPTLVLCLALLLAAPFAPASAPREDVRVLDGADGASVLLAPDDPSFPSQYNLAQVRAPEAWDLTLGSTAASVCILDTGVLATHEDLAGGRVLGGIDVVNGDADATDDHGHGTQMAGIAAATIGNGLGIAGVGNVGVYAVKVLTASGGGTFAGIIEGLDWCIANAGARSVILVGLGTSGGNPTADAAIEAAIEAGSIVVAGSGASGGVAWPANLPDVVAVGCTTEGEDACPTGGKGSALDVVAPATDIISLGITNDSAYRTSSGTSWAAATVAGALALAWSHLPDLTNAQLTARLLATAQDLGAPGHDDTFGCGELDVRALLDGPPEGATCGLVALGPPRDLVATTGTGAGEIALAWSPPSFDNGHPVTGYTILRANTCAGAFSALAQVGPGTLAYTDTGLGNGVSRCYRATAQNALGSSSASNADSAFTMIPPGAPHGARAEPVDVGTIALAWNAPSYGGPVAGYVVERAGAGGGYEEVARLGLATAWTDAEADPTGVYAYRVRAVNPAGASAPSTQTCSLAAGVALEDDVDCALWRATLVAP